MRLDRFTCRSTELTKEEAQTSIQNGLVFVNGIAVLDPSAQVHENNQITLSKEPLTPRPPRYLMMHKPRDTICSNIDEAYPSLFNGLEIEKKSELHIAGRLDADTTGLVLITDDGRWSFDITNPSKQCKKVYQVTLRDPLRSDVKEALTEGIMLQGEHKPTLPAELVVMQERLVMLTITEGRFHQVKRMFAAVGNKVLNLHRVQIGDIQLDLNIGEWRFLTEQEIRSFDQ